MHHRGVMDTLGVGHECREGLLGSFLFLLEDVEPGLRLVVLFIVLIELLQLLLYLTILVGFLRFWFLRQSEVLPCVGGVVIEFEHTRADNLGAWFASFRTLHQFVHDFLELVEQRLVGTGEAVGREIEVIIAVETFRVFRVDGRHVVIHVREDVNYVVFFNLIDRDLRQCLGV